MSTTTYDIATTSSPQTAPVTVRTLWTGRILSALVVLFLVFDGVVKLMQLPAAMTANAQLGYPSSAVFGIGILELACLALYVIPRTSVLGAVLLTGYLGGAVATHVRVGSPLFSIVFPVIMGALIWGGLYLREHRLRALVPLRR